jgi:hypothetical protein
MFGHELARLLVLVAAASEILELRVFPSPFWDFDVRIDVRIVLNNLERE